MPSTPSSLRSSTLESSSDETTEALGNAEPEFYTLSNDFIREHHDVSSTWQKVKLPTFQREIETFKNEAGFDLLAERLGVRRPRKERA